MEFLPKICLYQPQYLIEYFLVKEYLFRKLLGWQLLQLVLYLFSLNLGVVVQNNPELEDHLELLEQVEAAGVHKTKYAMPYENNLTIFIGRGFKRTLKQIKEGNKIFI